MTLLLASDTPQTVIAVGASLLMGAAVCWFVYMLQCIIHGPRAMDSASRKIESGRRLKISKGSRVYRLFEPLVDEIKGAKLLHFVGRISVVRADLNAGGDPLPFAAEEYLAVTAIRSLLTGTAVGMCICVIGGHVSGFLFGLIAAFSTFFVVLHRLHQRANSRRERFKQRLPFAVDLMALMMSAGSGFRESLTTVVRESSNHPLGEELGRTLTELNFGQTLPQALGNLRDRLADTELSELIFAINKGKEHGTPLSEIFLIQATQMRLKQSQRAEKLAGKANANISFPGLLVMIACILLVMTPFVLSAINETSSF